MQHLLVSLDPSSDDCRQAFEQLPQALGGLSVWLDYRLLLASRLQPAAANETAPQPLGAPAWLCLGLACEPAGQGLSRRVVEALMHQAAGAGGADPQALAELRQRLAPRRDPDSPELIDELRQATEAAHARGLTALPAFEWAGRCYTGLAALPDVVAQLRAASAAGAASAPPPP